MSSVSRHVPTEDGDLYIPLPTARHASRPRRLRNVELIAGLLLLMLSGCANFILLKVLFAAYGESAAFFVSQGINVIYCVYGGLIVYPRLLPSGVGDALSRGFGLEPITPRMRTWPHLRAFVVMGVLDCFGTFLTAMGAVYTPGQFQTLLIQPVPHPGDDGSERPLPARALLDGTAGSGGPPRQRRGDFGGALAAPVAPRRLCQRRGCVVVS